MPEPAGGNKWPGLELGRTWHGLLGLAVLASATAASLAGMQAVRTFFYPLAWWSYIFMVDALIQARQGNSLLVNRQGAFWFMFMASAFFWFAWELVNLRLNNWHYIGVPRQIWQRWPVCFLSYATVLPGVLGTYKLLQVLGLRKLPHTAAFNLPAHLLKLIIAAGVILFVLPLLWPRIFFPFVWLALTLILDPLNYRAKRPSLLAYCQRGDYSHLISLLLAGIICGFLWESWNFLAGARWVYEMPYLAEPKIFALPLAGYLGFPALALECFVFMSWLAPLRGGRGWLSHDHGRILGQPPPAWLLWGLVAAALAFDLIMLHNIDRFLVKGWLP